MSSSFKSNLSMFSTGAALILAIFILFGFANNDKSSPNTEDNTPTENYKVFSLAVPDHMSFAGEEVPLNIIDVKEKMDREMLVNTYWHSNTFLMIKRSNRWFDVMVPILEKNGIPEDFKYLSLVESGLTNVVSPAGASGFWQFMKETGRSYGLQINSEVDERYHVEKATQAACDYLNEAYEKFGSWALVAASYNMGMGGVNKKLNEQKVDSYWDLLLNKETGRYVYRILAVKEVMDNQEKYGFMINEEDLYSPYNTKTVEVSGAINNLADFALEQGINYKILKTLNPWLRKKSLVNKGLHTYEVKIPTDTKFEVQ